MNSLLQLLANTLIAASLVQQPDSDFVALRRDGCLGNCPIYSVTIYSTGTVEYVGYEFVAVEGRHTYSVPADSVAYLFRLAEEIDFFSFNDEYRSGKRLQTRKDGTVDTLTVEITDLPTYTVTIKRGGLRKSVVDYFRVGNVYNQELKKFEAPQGMRLIENEIDRIGRARQLVRRW